MCGNQAAFVPDVAEGPKLPTFLGARKWPSVGVGQPQTSDRSRCIAACSGAFIARLVTRKDDHADKEKAANAICLALYTVALTGCAPPSGRPAHRLAAPPIVNVDAWGGSPSTTTQPRHTISRITLHHQGEIVASDVDVPAYLRRLQQWAQLTRRWTDIPYHYVIAPDGVVYSAQPLAEPGDTNTEYNPRRHAKDVKDLKIQILSSGRRNQKVQP